MRRPQGQNDNQALNTNVESKLFVCGITKGVPAATKHSAQRACLPFEGNLQILEPHRRGIFRIYNYKAARPEKKVTRHAT
jgi:hypothetical protein